MCGAMFITSSAKYSVDHLIDSMNVCVCVCDGGGGQKKEDKILDLLGYCL